ncbi:hypothetical protein AVEN_223544-1 [Araneus ventricosus]|uniref:Uncharacterized protein n=1 Tax=Araneus ventricosus TaxID=182803 RepID=A0A4Y2MW52_ARAVE|nr:hypothetical protein AVEN_223544-1 [Araneus ventricosus]
MATNYDICPQKAFCSIATGHQVNKAKSNKRLYKGHDQHTVLPPGEKPWTELQQVEEKRLEEALKAVSANIQVQLMLTSETKTASKIVNAIYRRQISASGLNWTFTPRKFGRSTPKPVVSAKNR